jgi:ribosomal protein S12 methylthiotransferase
MDSKKEKTPVTVGFVALGCPKNIVDSEKMIATLAESGLMISGDVDNCDVVVVNTCGFIAPAEAEAMEHIRHAIKLKEKGTVKKIVVAGCLAQRLGEEILKKVPQVDAVVGLAGRDEIAKIVWDVISADEPVLSLGDGSKACFDDRGRILLTPAHTPYLRISEGCDHRCSFCTIPAIRGRFRSKPVENVIAEAEELASAGAVELNIIAQDTAYYGHDLEMKDGLSDLLVQLEKVEGIDWIRLMYLYPIGVTDKLLETVSGSDKILPYFDIPVQHINDRILKAMRRPDNKQLIVDLLAKIRRYCPHAALRSTVILGFPGETEDDFCELMEFVENVRFDALGAFTYYAEVGTPAAEMEQQVSEQIKKDRLDRLMLLQQKIVFEKNRELKGSEFTLLVDTVRGDGVVEARSFMQAPEIDSVCFIKNCNAGPGDMIDVRVTGSDDYDLLCEPLKG